MSWEYWRTCGAHHSPAISRAQHKSSPVCSAGGKQDENPAGDILNDQTAPDTSAAEPTGAHADVAATGSYARGEISTPDIPDESHGNDDDLASLFASDDDEAADIEDVRNASESDEDPGDELASLFDAADNDTTDIGDDLAPLFDGEDINVIDISANEGPGGLERDNGADADVAPKSASSAAKPSGSGRNFRLTSDTIRALKLGTKKPQELGRGDRFWWGRNAQAFAVKDGGGLFVQLSALTNTGWGKKAPQPCRHWLEVVDCAATALTLMKHAHSIGHGGRETTLAVFRDKLRKYVRNGTQLAKKVAQREGDYYGRNGTLLRDLCLLVRTPDSTRAATLLLLRRHHAGVLVLGVNPKTRQVHYDRQNLRIGCSRLRCHAADSV